MSVSRPGGVTFVAVLVWIQALVQLITGIFTLFRVPLGVLTLHLGFAASSLLVGIIAIVYGIIAFIVAGGLLRGSRVSRGIVTILLVLSLIGAIISLVNGAVGSGVFNLAVAVIGILLLWAGRAVRFFNRG